MSDTIGSLRGVTINGIQYRVAGDFELEIKLSGFETEAQPTSGNSLFKMTIVNPNAEGIELTCNADESEQLKEAAASLEDVDMSIALASGEEYKAQGRIMFDTVNTGTGKATVNLMPNNALEGWQKF